jgi:hypothetical protein
MLCLSAPVASGAPAPLPSPLQDSAVGDVFLGSGTFARFDARSGPRGENPSGSAFFLTTRSEVAGPVTCLTVIGNRATIGFENTLGGGSGGFFFVEDHGYPHRRSGIPFGSKRCPNLLRCVR